MTAQNFSSEFSRELSSETPAPEAARLVLVTAGSEAEAETIATTLVEQSLAACVSIIPIRSIYRWQGEIQHDAEWQLTIKTTQANLTALQAQILEQHSYDTPEFLVLPIAEGSPDYLAWLRSQCSP